MNSSIFITLLSLAIVGALAYFAAVGFRGSGKNEEVPPNLTKYKSDDELETKHLDKSLSWAVLVASLLTIMIPLYYLGEDSRQESFVEEFEDVSVERGHHLYEEFGCGNCHGVDGGGGAASYVEKRSGVKVTWAAPAINNVFYRYDDSEVKYWLIYGRANSPMPAWGLEGGGPMNDGQLEDLIDYLHSFQVDQSFELGTIETSINSSLLRLENSALQVENEIVNQKLLIEEIKAGPAKLPILEEAVAKISALLEKESGIDSDEDGLYDSVEIEISEYSATIADVVGLSILNLNPEEEESTPSRKDASVARGYLSQLNSQLINTGILVEGQEKFLNEGIGGLSFLETALEQRLWEVSFEEIADSTFEGNQDDAKRAIGLFNAYCARCHTAGYSAGVAYTKKIGSGGLGPALRGGRANIQFKSRNDLIDFIINGSVNGKGYGVNGVGGGKMPGFGAVLPQSDIELVIDYLRGMEPDA
ncbi:c-type cytochrome [Acidimicrobiia bacterium]|jgi:mono/diheme cytochrome c family protein|nr:c-type cytochrome [Acidimicrobiia bacterium]MDA9645399.1 c-type cytochrome [Candidatus Actinomarina sp.]MDC1070650.1 c-type cytochrome [Acidimicrobiia bacterium]|tara:strand:- start:5631 stop:7055 length:1425 start_codon:yes stop_codon:yes gene_type:complete